MAINEHQDKNSFNASFSEKYFTERLLRNGATVVFRPIECSDQDRFKEFFKSLSPATVHFRFLEIIKDLPNETVEKFCDLDYDKEIAIIALPRGEDTIVGVVRLMVDRAKGRGEFALVVADAWQGVGLGAEFLSYIIKIARDYGLMELYCVVSSDNLRMIGLAEKFGLKVKSADGDTLEMALNLA